MHTNLHNWREIFQSSKHGQFVYEKVVANGKIFIYMFLEMNFSLGYVEFHKNFSYKSSS